MLSESQRDQIRLEEQYRAEVRQSIATTAGASKVLTFLNSPFVIWFLSTVAIGLITWGYQSLQARAAAERVTTLRRSAVTAEIGFRLQPVDQMREFNEILAYLSELDSPATTRYMLGEFKGRSLSSLLWELRTLVPGNRDVAELLHTFQVIQKTPPSQPGVAAQGNYATFKVFCYHLNQSLPYSYRFSGALIAPVGIVTGGIREQPLTKQDLERKLP